ncbi:unnamed protein product, partial [Cuscuta europaea]
MHSFGILKCLVCVFLLILYNVSNAEEDSNRAQQLPDSAPFLIPIHPGRAPQSKSEDGNLKLGAPVVASGILCFIAATISSAGGIGGGGLYIPILTIVAGLDLKTSTSFSAFMVTGGIISNVVCNTFIPSGGKVLIDLDIALLSEPSMLLGVSIGVICNVVFPDWLITVSFSVFLVWSTVNTFKSGFVYWRIESEKRNGCPEMETVLVDKESSCGEEDPLRGNGTHIMKLGMLLVIWICFFLLHLFRGNRYGHGINNIEACGVVYWIISSIQIPLAVSLTTWILFSNQRWQSSSSKDQDEEGGATRREPNKLLFPVMALLAGVLGGAFGIGGGMLISPFLIRWGIPPQITAATCSFMVLFSSTMSVAQYLLLGMEHLESAMIFASICL